MIEESREFSRLRSPAVKRRLYVYCSYSETNKSIIRIRLVKTEKTWSVLMICKVWELTIAL
jgi:hypothetical protein